MDCSNADIFICGTLFRVLGKNEEKSSRIFVGTYDCPVMDIAYRQENVFVCRLVSSYLLNAYFLYSISIYMLHYNPQHVSSSTMLIFRRTNCIITASGIVTLCKRPYSMPVRGELSYLAPLGSENISAPYFKQCFFRGGGYYPPQTVKHHASQSQDRNNKYFILYIEFCINNKI